MLRENTGGLVGRNSTEAMDRGCRLGVCPLPSSQTNTSPPALQFPAAASHWLKPIRSQRARKPSHILQEMGLLGQEQREGGEWIRKGRDKIRHTHYLLLTLLPATLSFPQGFPSCAFSLRSLCHVPGLSCFHLWKSMRPN